MDRKGLKLKFEGGGTGVCYYTTKQLELLTGITVGQAHHLKREVFPNGDNPRYMINITAEDVLDNLIQGEVRRETTHIIIDGKVLAKSKNTLWTMDGIKKMDHYYKNKRTENNLLGNMYDEYTPLLNLTLRELLEIIVRKRNEE